MRLKDGLFAHFLHFEKYDRCNSILLTFNILYSLNLPLVLAALTKRKSQTTVTRFKVYVYSVS